MTEEETEHTDEESASGEWKQSGITADEIAQVAMMAVVVPSFLLTGSRAELLLGVTLVGLIYFYRRSCRR